MVPEMGTSGDFDYLGAEADSGDAVDVSDVHSARPAGTSEADLDYLLAEAESGGHDRFDAFDEKTWDYAFTPMPATPWYRSPQARTLLFASAAAVSAIVVSVVLLMFRGTSADNESVPAQSTTT